MTRIKYIIQLATFMVIKARDKLDPIQTKVSPSYQRDWILNEASRQEALLSKKKRK